jgi:TonB family protein
MTIARGFIVTLVVFGAGWPVAAQTDLDAVRGLYAAAEYEKALTAISSLEGDARPGGVDLDLYRILCLTALGRSEEADDVIEAIVSADPLFQPGDEMAPRIRTAFSTVRRRLSPAAARAFYAEGKTAFDRKEFAEAGAKFERAVAVIEHPDLVGVSGLEDLRTLATGFLDLSRVALKNAEPAVPAAVAAVPSPISSPARAASVVPMTDPVPIRQEMPKWTMSVAGTLFEAELNGVLEIEIDDRGSVTSASIIASIHPAYDQLLIAATRDWKYEPARQAGKAVKTRKRIDVRLRPR